MKKLLLEIACITSAFVLASCSSMYIPSMGNAPLLDKKGDGLGELSLTTNAVQMSGDYAITDHLAAMGSVNISYGNFTDAYDIYTKKEIDSTALSEMTHWGKFNNRHYEVGAGYYNMFNKDHFKMEAFGGLGFCHATDTNAHITNGSEKYDSKYTMLFGQLNTGFTTKVVDFGLAFRVAPTFHALHWDCHYDPSASKTNSTMTDHFTIWHFEPLLFLRLGYKHFKVSAKAGISFIGNTKSYQETLDKIPNTMYSKTTLMHFSIGACYVFNTNK